MQGVCNSKPLTFRVFGTPVPQPRARFAKGRAYTPANVERWKRQIRFACSQAVEASGWSKTEAPVDCSLCFYFPRPKSHFDGSGSIKPKHAGPWAFTKRKNDRDNIDKAVLDAITCANSSPWFDDSQVCAGSITKRWAHEANQPGVSVHISELPA